MRILMILVPDDGPTRARGDPALRLERLAGPYYVFRDLGVEVVLASPEGGSPWMPPPGEAEAPSQVVRRFKADRLARDALNDTLSLDQVAPEDFAGAFCVGVPDAVWRGQPDAAGALIATFLGMGKPVAATPGALDLSPRGSGDGLVIIADTEGASTQAAGALLAVLKP